MPCFQICIRHLCFIRAGGDYDERNSVLLGVNLMRLKLSLSLIGPCILGLKRHLICLFKCFFIYIFVMPNDYSTASIALSKVTMIVVTYTLNYIMM